MSTVGYGDIVPSSINEVIYVMFMTFLACGIFAYTVNVIGTIFMNETNRKSAFLQRKYQLFQYLTNREVSYRLQHDILKNLEEKNQCEEMGHNKGVQIIRNYISPDLQHQFKQEIYGNYLQEIPFFKNNFSVQLISKLAQQVQQQTFGTFQVIKREGDFCDKLFYIIKGEVQQFLEPNRESGRVIHLRNLGKKDYFGLGSILTENKENENSIRCLEMTSVIILERNSILEVFENFPREKQRFCEIQDRLQFYDHQQLEFSCAACDEQQHTFRYCPQITFQPNSIGTLLKYIYSKPQNHRIKFTRSQYRQSFQALQDHRIIQKQSQEIKQDCLMEFLDSNDSFQKQIKEKIDSKELAIPYWPYINFIAEGIDTFLVVEFSDEGYEDQENLIQKQAFVKREEAIEISQISAAVQRQRKDTQDEISGLKIQIIDQIVQNQICLSDSSNNSGSSNSQENKKDITFSLLPDELQDVNNSFQSIPLQQGLSNLESLQKLQSSNQKVNEEYKIITQDNNQNTKIEKNIIQLPPMRAQSPSMQEGYALNRRRISMHKFSLISNQSDSEQGTKSRKSTLVKLDPKSLSEITSIKLLENKNNDEFLGEPQKIESQTNMYIQEYDKVMNYIRYFPSGNINKLFQNKQAVSNKNILLKIQNEPTINR